MNAWRILLAPLACALLGWLFGLVAGKLLFRPRAPLCLGPFCVQGLLPGRQAALAKELGTLVKDKLFSAKDLAQSLDTEEFRATLRRSADNWVDRLLDKDSRLASLASLLLPDATRASLKQGLGDKLETLSARLAEAAAQGLAGRADLGRLAEERFAALPAGELEDLLVPLLRRDLRRLALATGCLGFVLGWVQALLAFL